jgi:hypothetical protein
MKKFAVVILAFLYITTSTGATLNMHYCMGKLADWDLGHNTTKNCGSCGMEKGNGNDNGCCKDEQKLIKNDTDQKSTGSSFFLIRFLTPAELTGFAEMPLIRIASLPELNPVSNAPPRCTALPIYKRNRTFLI